MAFPIKTCSICSKQFELKPDKPGFANRCPECSEPEETAPALQNKTDAAGNAARRAAMRDLLYRKDS